MNFVSFITTAFGQVACSPLCNTVRKTRGVVVNFSKKLFLKFFQRIF